MGPGCCLVVSVLCAIPNCRCDMPGYQSCCPYRVAHLPFTCLLRLNAPPEVGLPSQVELGLGLTPSLESGLGLGLGWV